MKKTIVAVAALAFALGAFADGVPSVSWFTATPGNLDDGAWTLTPTATEPLVENNVWVVDTETPGEDDAIYTPKILKADKKTRVALNIAFGAAYAKAELPDEPTDAQTGLVLGIDGGVTNFYGLVSGGWKKLTGGVPADLDDAVNVTVEIDYEANPVTLSFKVGNAVLADAADSTVTTFQRYAGTTATSLASVGFAGSGKIASIAGDADPKYVVDGTGYLDFAAAMAAAGSTKAIELYYNASYTFPTDNNYTLMIKPTGSYAFTPTFGDGSFSKVGDPVDGVVTYNAWKKVTVTIPAADGAEVTVAATGSGNDPIEGTDGAYTVAQGDTVTATYEATEGNVISGGKETKTDVVLENVTGGEVATAPTFVVGKAKYNGELYDTVQNAVNAAEANSEIVIVADSTEPVSIGKAVTFTGNADYVVGAITLTEGGTLTIVKGKYDVLNPVTTDNLVLKGGLFTSEAADIQAFCTLGYFAQTIVGTGYQTAVKEGEVIDPGTATDVPAIAVEPGFIPEGTPDKVEYLKEEQANQQPRWVNYALGLDGTDSTATVELADKGDADTISIDLAAGALKAGTGLTAKYETADGTEWKPFDPEIALDDETPVSEVATIRLVLTDTANKDFVVKEVDYGLKSETPTAGLSVISVPFTELGSENGLPLSKVLKLKNIAEGDKIYRYDAVEGKNVAWTLTADGQWSGETAPSVKPGEGLWLERADNSKPVYFFGGFQATKAATPVASGKWALVANPSLTKTLSLDEIIPMPKADMQVTIETGAEPKIFTCLNGVWGYNKKGQEQRTVGKRTVTVTTVTRVTDESVIAPGQGFWFANGMEETNLNWNNN